MNFIAKLRILACSCALAAISSMAMAATTTLSCRSNNNGSLGPDLFELNEAKSSVTIKFSTVRSNNGSILPARTSGPLHATFAPNTITISSSEYGTVNTYVINRITATVTLTQVSNNHVAGHSEWTCQVGKAKF